MGRWLNYAVSRGGDEKEREPPGKGLVHEGEVEIVECGWKRSSMHSTCLASALLSARPPTSLPRSVQVVMAALEHRWIMRDQRWVTDSHEAGRFLPEEQSAAVPHFAPLLSLARCFRPHDVGKDIHQID